MAILDYEYIGELVKIAQAGDSNAFAELYAATYQKQYDYSYRYLGDKETARQALEELYVEALTQLQNLQNPELFVPWLNRISFKICYDLEQKSAQKLEDENIKIDRKHFRMNQILNLPLTESQVLIQHYYQMLSVGEISDNLDISKTNVKRYILSGKAHLNKLTRNAG